MQFNHICVMVSDLDVSLPFYRDLLGFSHTLSDFVEPGFMFDQPTLDAVLGAEGVSTRIAVVASPEGAVLELQQALNPPTERADPLAVGYRRSGITELALTVPDIEELFARVTAAGVRTQTDFIWSPSPGTRSFLFYDPDGALIQAVQMAPPDAD